MTGGTIVIQQFARHLATTMKVNLVVRQGDTKPLPGVSIHRSPTLSQDTLPDGDLIVLYINARESGDFFNLPESKGERLLLFQGYDVLGDQMVKDRLGMGLRVLAVSKWLVEEARRFGAVAEHTPHGLDNTVFFPGPSAEARGNVVTMMFHPIYWKGPDDGVSALALVKKERPDAEIRLFGVYRPPELPFPHTLLSLDSQAKVAELLRETAVFVCPSWEEGFGMPGLEALACGAALATTDTKGSRDYATHGKTALVSAPRKPELLAENVLKLLDDLELRRRLGEQGARYVHSRFKPWPEAAQIAGRALLSRKPSVRG